MIQTGSDQQDEQPAPALVGVAHFIRSRAGDRTSIEVADLLEVIGRADANGESMSPEVLTQAHHVAFAWLMDRTTL